MHVQCIRTFCIVSFKQAITYHVFLTDHQCSYAETQTRTDHRSPGHLRLWDFHGKCLKSHPMVTPTHIWPLCLEKWLWAVLHQLCEWEAPTDLHRTDTKGRAGRIRQWRNKMDAHWLLQQQDCVWTHRVQGGFFLWLSCDCHVILMFSYLASSWHNVGVGWHLFPDAWSVWRCWHKTPGSKWVGGGKLISPTPL